MTLSEDLPSEVPTVSPEIQRAREKKRALPVDADAVPLNVPARTARQLIEAKDRSAPLQVTGKLKRALDAMVWQALDRAEAAAQSGMSDHGLREALRKKHVKAYYKEQCDVLRTSALAKNIHAMLDVRDQKDNHTARVAAVKMLQAWDQDEQAPAAGMAQRPGVVIVIKGQAEVSARYSQSTAKSLDLKANVPPDGDER